MPFWTQEGVSDGFASLHVGMDGKILGATIVGPSAGDHISEVTLCMQHDVTADQLLYRSWQRCYYLDVFLCSFRVLQAMQSLFCSRAPRLAGTIHPYPTAAEVVRQAAQAYVRSRIFQPGNQELLKRMSEPCEFIQSERAESGLHAIVLLAPVRMSLF